MPSTVTAKVRVRTPFELRSTASLFPNGFGEAASSPDTTRLSLFARLPTGEALDLLVDQFRHSLRKRQTKERRDDAREAVVPVLASLPS
jgi:hypothetical protein